MSTTRACCPVADLVAMVKPGIAAMVVLTTACGYFLVAPSGAPAGRLLAALCGVALAGSASSVLNQVIERRFDGRMPRTRMRPLPAGRMGVAAAAWFGLALGAGGITLLAAFTNALTAVLAAATLLAYLCIYTPLKRVTVWNTVAGAVPGAMPPLLGYTAAHGRVTPEALVLFAILFLWQLPHFFSIAWLYREDYRLGGFCMLSRDDQSGARTGRWITLLCVLLCGASLLPLTLGRGGMLYAAGALLVSLVFLAAGVHFWRRRTRTAARAVLGASLAYLPVVFGLLATGL